MDTFERYEALENAVDEIENARHALDGISEFSDYTETLQDALDQMQKHLSLLSEDLQREQMEEARWMDQ